MDLSVDKEEIEGCRVEIVLVFLRPHDPSYIYTVGLDKLT